MFLSDRHFRSRDSKSRKPRRARMPTRQPQFAVRWLELYGESGNPTKWLERSHDDDKKYRLSLIAYSKLIADGFKLWLWDF